MLKELKQTLKNGLPIVFSQLSHIMIGFTDIAMVGLIGVIPVAAAGFGTNIFNVFLVFGFGISSVTSAFIGKAIGERNHAEVGTVLRHSLIVALVSGIVLYALIEMLIPFLSLFHQKPEVLTEAIGFLRLIGLSIIPLSFVFVYRKFCEGVQSNVYPMLMFWVAVLLNIFFNWVFIFGHLGAPAMGLLGSGLGTLLARIILLLLFIAHVHWAPRYKIYQLHFHFRHCHPQMLWQILANGIPSGLQYLNEIGAFAFAAIMMGWISAESLAAHQVALQFPVITFMVVIGIATASSVRVAHAWGSGDFITLKKVAYSSLLFIILFMGVSGIFLMVFRHQLPLLIVRDTEVVRIAAQLLIVGALFQISDGVQGVLLQLLRGLMDITIPLWVTVFSYWIVGIPVSIYLGFYAGFGPVGIWIGLLTGLTISSGLLMLRFRHLITRMESPQEFDTLPMETESC